MTHAIDKATPVNDAWDWPFLLYMATVHLRRSEDQFWLMRPRKFVALVKAHIYYKSGGKSEDGKEKAPAGYIDQIL
ncbi:hypothetical protein D3C79_716070 [compost metagenome]